MNDDKNRDKNAADSRDFWDLGRPRGRIYKAPEFAPGSLESTEITEDGAERRQVGEAIPQRSANHSHSPTVVKTINGSRIVTDSYKSRASRISRERLASAASAASPKAVSVIEATHTDFGPQISRIDVKTRGGDEFYGKFATNAHRSHADRASHGVTPATERVPYFSYVPQYSHMNLPQITFYKAVRESIIRGEYPECDLSYVLLYIYEIINLPDLIPADEGVELLSGIWLGYRKMHPRLDSYLCEWLPDYCMIRGIPLPECIYPLLPDIVPKAQFKEFYFSVKTEEPTSTATHACTGELPFILAKTLIELSSDYDYRSAKYYTENRTAYDTQIPAAISHVMHEGKISRRGIFSADRVYKITRDTYAGAVASSGIKRWLDIEFTSFTRRADTRDRVTALVKYAENKLRVTLGIKAKLSPGEIDPADTAVIDRFFDPIIPAAAKLRAEDRYMPADYMKNYESEDSGFDFTTAAHIERTSWSNTALLTGEDPSPTEEPVNVEITVPGELSFEDYFTDEPVNDELIPDPAEAAHAEKSADDVVRLGVERALKGKFAEFCRECGLHPGELSDRINNVFIDVLGDVILEDHGDGYELIEDYREDIENWLL